MSLQPQVVKKGDRLVKQARYYWLLLAEGRLTRRVFGATVRRTAVLGPPGWGGELECAKTRLGLTCFFLNRQLRPRPISFFKDSGLYN